MPRHKLTVEERLRGTERALRSRRTPKYLKAGLERYRRKLERELRQKRGSGSNLFEW
jgi:hypothetical protein